MVIKKTDKQAIIIVFEILKRGGIIILPCDTIYGFVGLAGIAEGHIAQIKKREKKKPFLYLIPDTSWLSRFTDTKLPESLCPYWPGPLTVIFPKREDGSIALRVPRDTFLQKICYKLDNPIISTSVNIEGELPLNRITDIRAKFESKVDLIIDNGDINDALPSTIIDIRKNKFHILRQGKLTLNI